jgi:tripartite-type tricarboxylate transporter receptor subunit TctC
MKLHRRRVLTLAGAALAAPLLPRLARAQAAYPARPVRVIVATAAGATTDIIARLMAQFLSERVGQQFLIENRPGGGNTLGTEAVVRAAPDGYTLLLVNAVNAINVTLFEKLNYVFSTDIVPVAGIIRVPLVMQVNPSVPAKTVPEFIVTTQIVLDSSRKAQGFGEV